MLKAHRLLYHLTLGLRVIKKKESQYRGLDNPEFRPVPSLAIQAGTLFSSLPRCRANSAHIRQSMPDSGLGFQVKVLKTFKLLIFPRKRSEHASFFFVFITLQPRIEGYKSL